MTSKETVNYNYSTGINRLSNISIPSSAVDNVKITASGKSYVIHKDFEIANGNEIRWRQYDRGTEVALGDTVNVKYTMAAGDVYEASGTYNDTEAAISNFDMTDDGTLASRLRVEERDDDGNVTRIYTYGTDFTITNNKVVWLEEESATTNEPSSYTVSYNKTETVSTSINGTKGTSTVTYTDEPDSYIVRYDDKAQGSYTQTATANNQYTIDIDIDFDKLSNLYKASTGDDLTLYKVRASNDVYCIDPSDAARSAFSITSGGTTYEYGRDFVIRTKDNTTDTSRGNWQITWAKNSTAPSSGTVLANYARDKGISGTALNSPASAQVTFGYAYDYDYTRMGRVSSSDNDKLLTTVFGSDFDMANFDPDMLKIRGYTYGTDFTVNTDTTSSDYGEIQWLDKTTTSSSIDDALIDSDFTTLQNAYNQTYGTTSIPTVTLTDGDGVLRTYLDPADSSLFKMTSGSETYEYGKDYVIRVNDDHKGYTISWAVSNDVNGDTIYDINDANTVVTTYTQYKNLTTYDMKKAPDSGNSYNLTFTGTSTKSASGKVTSSATDKTLATVLSGTTVNSSDYSSAITITSGSKTYTYGKDYVVDKTRTITWLNQNSDTPAAYTANYTFSSNPSVSMSVPALNTNGVRSISGAGIISIDSLGTKTFTDSSYTYVDENEGKAAFTLTDSNGNTYEYGKDYAVRYFTGSTGTKNLTIVSAKEGHDWPSALTNRDSSTSMPKSGLTLTYNNSVLRTVISSETLEEALGFIPSNYTKLAITDPSGNAYTKDTDYTLDTSTGAVTWLNTSSTTAPKHPTGSYTLTYEAFDAIEATGTYEGSTTQEVAITVESGYGNYDNDKRSYEQILKDTGLTSSSKPEDWAKYFTLTDATSKTYVYGTDYTITQGTDTDSSTGEHNVFINWINPPSATNTNFTLSYGGNGGEVVSTDGVTRSATDSISGSPLATAFDGGTNVITYGGKTFYEGEDFNITKDSSGNATVTWVKDSSGGSEWYYPTSNSTYTITHTDDDGNSTSYSATRTSSTSLNMSDYGLTTAKGSISVQYGNDDWYYNLDAPDSGVGDGRSVIRGKFSVDITPTTGNSFNFRWVAPTLTSRSNLPAYGAELTVDYEYDANTFDLSDDSDGSLLYALGFTKSDGSYDDYTAAKNAILEVDGQEYERDSNDIGESYENELIKGVTLHLKGTGYVSLDISHDAEKAVSAIQTYVDNYNSLMTWMNTRMTEKELDEDAKATVDSDDFKMRWGLLHGDPLLRQTKSQMRSIMAQNFTFTFTSRQSSEEIYGTMAHNGLRTASTLRLRIGSNYVDLTIDPTDTLETIAAKLNDDTKNGAMHKFNYDDSGNKLSQPMIKAEIQNDMLVIHSTDGQEITMSGSAAMNALKMNYTYRGLYQLGIATTSTDYGKSGELEFDSSKFMEALEDNPDEVQTLMLKFASEMDSWLKSMTTTSASGETTGTLTRQISDLDTRINSINEYLQTYQDRLDRMEERLRTQYAAAEQNFAKLSQQASSMASILQMMSGNNSGSSNSSSSS
ncbi:MAG: flagellar filament capping protein FliD [Synergistaceae bacterium]|nr:flagellar filament capping protein FliD [Synergistaceae bacterium]